MAGHRHPSPLLSAPTSLKCTLSAGSRAAPSSFPKAGLQGERSGCEAPASPGFLGFGGGRPGPYGANFPLIQGSDDIG